MHSSISLADQIIDAGTKVIEDEILLRLRVPMFDGQLDTEHLVYREGNIEKIQAVDAEIVDDVGFLFDSVARDVANLGDYSGNGIERRGRWPLVTFTKPAHVEGQR